MIEKLKIIKEILLGKGELTWNVTYRGPGGRFLSHGHPEALGKVVSVYFMTGEDAGVDENAG